MENAHTDLDLATILAALTRASSRKKAYAAKAARAGLPAEARLLRALAASEETQARRLLNNMRGRIDRSEDFLAAVFGPELDEIIAAYSRRLEKSKANGEELTTHILDQLRRSELRLKSFYDSRRGKVTVPDGDHFHLCPFCGYLATGSPPDSCPVCGGAGTSFRKLD